MITLNTDQGLVRVSTWEEVENRPGFTARLDPKASPLKSIIGSYAFADFHPCGLSICRTPHGRGYVVQTIDGSITNLGKDCGKKYFSVDFEKMAKVYDRDLRAQEQREALVALQHQLSGIRARIETMKDEPNGANWLTRMLKVMRDPAQGLPTLVLSRLGAMIRRRDGTLTVSREATADEIALWRAQGQRIAQGPVYTDDIVGHVEGMAALYPENDLRALLVTSLHEGLQTLEEVDVATLSAKRRRDLAKWSENIEPTLDRAALAIAHGRQLLTQTNLGQLDKLASDRDERRKVAAFAATLRAG